MASIIYYIGFLLFTILCFIPFTLLFFLTVWFDKERVVLHYASRFWAVGIYRLCPCWQVRLEGAEKIDRRQNYVIITNHQSMLDIPLMYKLPLTFKWVSKKEVRKMPVFGWVLQMHGDIAIERGSSRSARKMMREAGEILGRGKTSIIMFPEGTRSKDGRIGRFREGAFAIAKLANVPILPVVHDGNASVAKGWKLRMPHRFRIKVLEPIPADQVQTLDMKQLMELASARMVDEYGRMRPDSDEKEKQIRYERSSELQ